MDERTTDGALFPEDLVLTPLARRPLRLPEATLQAVDACDVGGVAVPPRPGRPPEASLVVVTYNNRPFTKLCLASVLAHTTHPAYEVIVVDNASDDGTAVFLQDLARRQPHVRVIANPTNRGFAAATNQGLAAARGDVLVLLNNDTLVPPGWLASLAGGLADPTVGAVGPMTNRCGNEAELDAPVETYGAFLRLADACRRQRAGVGFDLPMLTMFCLALRRDVFDQIGPLDEGFGLGLFEDDDYAQRLRAAGYRLVCAEDVFVYHFGEASLGALAAAGAYGTLFHANRRRFEEKWGRAWQPHARPRSAAYRDALARVRAVARRALPADAVVAVVSKGDDEWLRLGGRDARHFPQDPGGGYAGYHPADSTEAIGQVEAARRRGARYLLFPGPSLWWLDHYDGLRAHLEAHYTVCAHEDDTCLIVALHDRSESGGRKAASDEQASRLPPSALRPPLSEPGNLNPPS